MRSSDELAVHRTDLATLRSHLANERTHLAYLRTAVSLISFGITVNRFSIYLRENRDLSPESTHFLLRNTENVGSGMVVLGLVLMVWSLHRFWRVSGDIEHGQHVPRYRSVLLLTLGLILLGGVSVVWLFRM
jgi:putative membrane protein